MQNTEKHTVSVRQAAQMLGTTLTFAYHELWANRFAGARKVGKHWEIPVESIRNRRKERSV